uniref:Uncharacterized protein n=1 Tax=Romanomermis culicivorax TaxID=13658 RepID=A0A915KNL5_ROMCU
GIPFYPFNDAGAIAGGTKSNVGYGDWGGSYAERSGVSDFWDASKKYEANWQRGNYMFSDGWNVPLTGISGFKQNGVTMGGLGNPSDWPSVVSGGILPRSNSNNFMPSLGAGTIPMFGGGLSNGEEEQKMGAFVVIVVILLIVGVAAFFYVKSGGKIPGMPGGGGA